MSSDNGDEGGCGGADSDSDSVNSGVETEMM